MVLWGWQWWCAANSGTHVPEYTVRGGVQSRSRRKGFSRLISRQYNQNRALLLQSFQADGLATRAKNVFLANKNNAIVWRPLVRKIPHERMGAQLGGFCVAYRLCRMRKNGHGDIWSLTASWTHSLRPVGSAMHERRRRGSRKEYSIGVNFVETVTATNTPPSPRSPSCCPVPYDPLIEATNDGGNHYGGMLSSTVKKPPPPPSPLIPFVPDGGGRYRLPLLLPYMPLMGKRGGRGRQPKQAIKSLSTAPSPLPCYSAHL